MAENERNARPTLRRFYKDFLRGRKFESNRTEIGVHKFLFWKHSRPNQGILQLVQGPWQWKIWFKLWKIGQKWQKTSETQGLPFGYFIKTLGEAVNLSQIALKQVCTNLFFELLQPKKGFCSQFRVPANGKYGLSCGKSDRYGQKRAKRKAYPPATL